MLYGALEQGRTDDGYILESRPLAGSDWLLYAVVHKERFFSGINRQLLILAGAVSVVTALVFVLTVLALRPVIKALLQEKQLFELSHRDGLTGLYNHAYLEELLDREIERARRHGRTLSVLMFDIDHFKAVNDTYGHQAGDEVLRCIARIASQTARRIDFVARYGGEEFMMILPETGVGEAGALAERLRGAVMGERMSTAAGVISVTISIGVASCNEVGDACDRHAVIEAADKALYASKDGGRNRVTAVTPGVCA